MPEHARSNRAIGASLYLLRSHTFSLKNQQLIGLSLLVLSLYAAWRVAGTIATGDLTSLYYAAFGFAGLFVAVTILRNWRLGFYFFLTWLLFEDFVRKFLGNNMAIYFGKDVLVGLVYVSLFVEIRRGRAKLLHLPFWAPLLLFVWLGILQVFNFNSPHILYGLMGVKIYFYYIPLMFVGYALLRTDEDLRKFLAVNAVLASAIAALGIVQAIVGNSFLSPKVLAPELQELGDLDKMTPLSNQMFNLPASVFVSSGRFSIYLVSAGILAMGSVGYLLLHSKRSRKLVFVSFGAICVAALLSGSRGAVIYLLISSVVLTVGFLWGAPWRWGQAHRLVRAVRRSFIMGAFGLALLVSFFPDEAGSRVAFYIETLNPSSSAYQGSNRGWAYPIENLELAFTNPNWVLGNGIGTASLGTQYVAKIAKIPRRDIWVEEGYGNLIIEMGIIAPFLWIAWTGALLYSSWKITYRLRETRLFPIAFAIIWYVFLILYPLTFGGLSPYQNYICNAYLWLLVGMLFRLPDVLESSPNPSAAVINEQGLRRGGLRF